jgi:anaerobic ribonucleoside-triphosphate reductase activating protein
MWQRDCDIVINVADVEPVSVSNGPGQRFVIWVQGCPFRCNGCSNETFLEFRPARQMSVSALAERILAHRDIEGVTLSGGEPMSQAEGLAALVSELRSAGLSVVCFSGYTLQELQVNGDEWQQKLLSLIDVLIDGRYNQNFPGGGLTGSTNQRIHFLSSRYSSENVNLTHSKTIELESGANSLTATGVFEAEVFERLQRVLENGPQKLIKLDD